MTINNIAQRIRDWGYYYFLERKFMSYKTGNLKMFKGSLKKFKKYNPVAWRNRWLFNLKAGDFIFGCDGVNHKIKEIIAKPTTRMTGGSLRNIREVTIYFEDNFSCDPYYCVKERIS